MPTVPNSIAAECLRWIAVSTATISMCWPLQSMGAQPASTAPRPAKRAEKQPPKPAATPPTKAAAKAPAPPAASVRMVIPWFAKYMPADTVMACRVSLAQLAQHPASRPLYEVAKSNSGFRQNFRLSASMVRDATVFIRVSAPGDPATVLRTRSPLSTEAVRLGGKLLVVPREHFGRTYLAAENGRSFFGAGNILVISDEANIKRFLEQPAGEPPATHNWLGGLSRLSVRHVAVAIDAPTLRKLLLENATLGFLPPETLNRFAPLLESTTELAIGLGIGDRLTLHLVAESADPKSAQRLEQEIKELVQSALEQLSVPNASGEDPQSALAIDKLKSLGPDLLKNAQTTRQGKRVELKLDCPLGVERCRHLVRMPDNFLTDDNLRLYAAHKMDQLARAMYAYHKDVGHFPPAVLLGPDGKTPHSWRVALLPYLDESDLYAQYRLGEPWDSPHNRKLLVQAPDVLRAANEKPDSVNTSYFVLTGKDTVFGDPKGTNLREVIDGPHNTVLIVETKREIPWTRPEDIPFDADAPPPKLGGIQQKGFMTIFLDRSAIGFPENFDPQKMKAAFTKAGGEPFSFAK